MTKEEHANLWDGFWHARTDFIKLCEAACAHARLWKFTWARSALDEARRCADANPAISYVDLRDYLGYANRVLEHEVQLSQASRLRRPGR